MTSFRIIKKPNTIQHQIIDGVVHVEVYSMTTCSGCYEFIDGHPQPDSVYDKKWNIPLGVGCHECAYKGKVRMGMWIPVEKSSRKNCFTCKNLDWYQGEDGETLDSSGWTCDKRQAPMNQHKESEFSSQLQNVEFRLRSKSCHEAR